MPVLNRLSLPSLILLPITALTLYFSGCINDPDQIRYCQDEQCTDSESPDAGENDKNSRGDTDDSDADPEPTCDDGIHNGDETDIDCGGPDCEPCAEGLACQTGTDCLTSICTQDQQCAICDPDATPFGAGSGNEQDPYLLCSRTHLNNITDSMDASFQLADHIDLENNYFAPIGSETEPFKGTLDGAGYEILNLNIESSDATHIGFFSLIGPEAYVQNMTFKNARVAGEEYVGVLAGVNKGKLLNIYISGELTGKQTIGLLVGKNEGLISDADVEGQVRSIFDISDEDQSDKSSNIGLLAGENYNQIKNAHATGTLSGYEIIGGLVGYNDNGPIENSSAAVDVTGERIVGGLIGQTSSEDGSVRGSHATGTVSGHESIGGLIGLLENSEIFESYAEGDIQGDVNTGGLVGMISHGIIINSHATGDIIGSTRSTGGLAGELEEATVTGCYASGNVTGENDRTGGLVGFLNKGRISDSYAKGDIQGSINTGGLVGMVFRGYLENSHATGDITVNTDAITVNTRATGGLAGELREATVTGCYASGKVTGGNEQTGGLVGHATGETTIEKSYATGDVSGNSFTGGLVGANSGGSIIITSFASGDITGNTGIGGLVGRNLDWSMVQDTYALGVVEGDSYVGGVIGDHQGTIDRSYAFGHPLSIDTANLKGPVIGPPPHAPITASDTFWNGGNSCPEPGQGQYYGTCLLEEEFKDENKLSDLFDTGLWKMSDTKGRPVLDWEAND